MVEPKRFGDPRGYFQETYHAERYRKAGIGATFVQDNLSRSTRGTVRGLHFQTPPHAQAKLVQVLDGEVFDVAVDLRHGSPTFGGWLGVTLSAGSGRQLFVPEGFAHGFCVTSETALVAYKCSALYAPEAERTVRWDDPDIGVEWPALTPVLSARDAVAAPLAAAGTPFI